MGVWCGGAAEVRCDVEVWFAGVVWGCSRSVVWCGAAEVWWCREDVM